MPTMTIAWKDLPYELRALPKRDAIALRAAILRTLSYDAQRWIQWSIRGGGAIAPRRPTASGPRKKKGRLARLAKKLRSALRRLGGKRPPGTRRVKSPGGCGARPTPTYRTPVDTGDYANSWRYQLTSEGGLLYSASNPPEKAGVIEEGRRAAWIPIAPLAEWVRRKLNCPDPKRARAIAYAISKYASTHPRKGLHVLGRAHPKIAEAMQRNVERELHVAIKRAVLTRAIRY